MPNFFLVYMNTSHCVHTYVVVLVVRALLTRSVSLSYDFFLTADALISFTVTGLYLM